LALQTAKSYKNLKTAGFLGLFFFFWISNKKFWP